MSNLSKLGATHRRISSSAVAASGALLMGAVVVVVGVWFLVRQERSLVAMRQETATLTQASADLQNVEGLLERTVAARLAVGQYLITRDSLPRAIEQLESLGLVAGVDLEVASASVVTTPEPRLRFALAVRGPFAATTHFTKLLEALPAVVQIASLDLQASSAEGKALPVWSGTIGVDILNFVDTPAPVKK